MTTETALELEPHTACFVCGSDNPRGLQIRFFRPEPGAVCAEWTPASHLEGFKGIVHGGILSTVLDEAMSQAVQASGWRAVTCELRVRIRSYVASGEKIGIRGWVVERKRRRILTEAALTDPCGQERAHAWATFLMPAGE